MIPRRGLRRTTSFVGHPRTVKPSATLAFGTDFKTNGSIASIKLDGPTTENRNE